MSMRVLIDRSGRFTVPKAIRDEMGLRAGDSLSLEAHDERITLTQVRVEGSMVRKQGIWVHQSGEKLGESAVNDLIEQMREERIQQIMGTFDSPDSD